MVYRSRNKIMIQIEAIVPDDAEHFHGAEIEDFDRNTGMALLYVDADDIDYKIVPHQEWDTTEFHGNIATCLLYTSPSPRDVEESRMPSSA